MNFRFRPSDKKPQNPKTLNPKPQAGSSDTLKPQKADGSHTGLVELIAPSELVRFVADLPPLLRGGGAFRKKSVTSVWGGRYGVRMGRLISAKDFGIGKLESRFKP